MARAFFVVVSVCGPAAATNGVSKMTLQELLKLRAKHLGDAQAICDAVKSEDRDRTAEECTQIDELLALADGVDEQIKTAEANENRDTRLQAGLEAVNSPSFTVTTGNTFEPNLSVPVNVRVGKPRIEDDPQRGFNSVGDFASAVKRASLPGVVSVDERLTIGAAATGLEAGTGSGMGWIMPPEFSTTIWDGLRDSQADLLSKTDNYTINGEYLELLANAETSRATGSRYGGVRGYWIGEADQITSSAPKVRKIRLDPQELAVLVYVTNKLLNGNESALTQYLTRAATEEIGFLVNDAIINGDGSAKPQGLMGAGSLVTVGKETGQSAATVVHQNITKMFARLSARSRASAAWYINQDIEPQLSEMFVGTGVSGTVSYLPPGGISEAPFARLMGKPVIPIEFCQTLGTAGDIILADLNAYASGTRGSGVDQASSIHLRFDFAETAFRFMFAVDGQPWLASAITPAKGSNTQSPFVALATRA